MRVHGLLLGLLSGDGALPSVPGEFTLLQPVDLVSFDLVSATGRLLKRLDHPPDNDDLHDSRTILRRAQWNVKMNKPCRLTPTVNNICNRNAFRSPN